MIGTAFFAGSSQAALATSADEMRFRIQAPNSEPRSIAVVTLSDQADEDVRKLTALDWREVEFFIRGRPHESGWTSSPPKFETLDGARLSASEIVSRAHYVIMVTTSGQVNSRDAINALACAACPDHKSLIGLVLSDDDGGLAAGFGEDFSLLRSDIRMVVVASDTGYLETLLRSLGA
jgi:hypothetical protein